MTGAASPVAQDIYKDSNSPSLTLMAYIVWVVFSSVLLMNLLIAMMGKTFQKDYEDTDRIWTFPFASLVLKYERMLTKEQVGSALQRGEPLDISSGQYLYVIS
jgi:hypothetical protein